MARYRKKPIVVEAVRLGSIFSDVRYRDRKSAPCLLEMAENLPKWVEEAVRRRKVRCTKDGYNVETLEGTMTGHAEDMLIRGVRGELYICRGDIFLSTYDAVEDS